MASKSVVSLSLLIVLCIFVCVSHTQLVSAQIVATFSIDFAQTTINQAMPTTLVVIAKDGSNNTVISYTSQVTITCSDPQAKLPTNLTSPLVKGSGTFAIYFGSTGTQLITISDSNNKAVNSTININVVPTHFSVTSSPSLIYSGQSVNVVITALDSSNNVLKSLGSQGYGASINFTSTDSQAKFPPSTTNLVKGAGTFSIVLQTFGSQTITATNIDFPQIRATTNTITVNPQPTLNPTAETTAQPTIAPTLTPTYTPAPTGLPISIPSSFPTAKQTTLPSPTKLPDIWPQTQIILIAVIIGVSVVAIIIATVIWSMEKNSKANLTEEKKQENTKDSV
jgi:hypothetical protein